MARRSNNSSCAFCENSNLASICASCVNYRLNDYNTLLKSMQNIRNSLYRKVEAKLAAKKKMDDQLNWRILQNEKIEKLKSRLHSLQKQLSEDKIKLAAASNDLKDKNESLEASFATISQNRVDLLEKFFQNLNCTQNLGHMAITSELLHKQSVIIKQICKLFPVRRVYSNGDKTDGSSTSYDQICNARLPRGLDPHSVPSEELAASLGYMVQLSNLAIPSLAAPALHNSGFAGSNSRIWQRDSYWDARPSSQSKEYPLFIPRQNFCSSGGDTSWSDKSSSDFGIASVESERKSYIEASSSFNYSSASPHSVETHKDLQKGISLLKKSVACVTAYCYNYLCLDVPSEASTFEAFARLLAILSSSREMRSVLSLKMASARSDAQAQRINKSTWNVNSGASSRSLEESSHTVMMPSDRDNTFSNSVKSFLCSGDVNNYNRKPERSVDGWDLVEHPTLPPPPSQAENVEHWARAMFIDATKKL